MSDGTGLTNAVAGDMTAPMSDLLLDQVPADASQLTIEMQKSIFEKIRFKWRTEDEQILVRIRAHAEEEFTNNFADAIKVIDRFYATIRVPKMQNIDGQWMPVLDNQRRQVWEMDDFGRPKEDWNQVNGQDLEEAMMYLERIRFDARRRVSWLMSQAIYAKYAAGDYHDDTYVAVVEGTINDRNSKANRETRPDRYHAFFRFVLWHESSEFLDEIGHFMEYLAKIRNWKSFERDR